MLRKRRWITFERLLTENELEKLQQLETNIPLFLINILLIFIHLWNSYLQKKKRIQNDNLSPRKNGVVLKRQQPIPKVENNYPRSSPFHHPGQWEIKQNPVQPGLSAEPTINHSRLFPQIHLAASACASFSEGGQYVVRRRIDCLRGFTMKRQGIKREREGGSKKDELKRERRKRRKRAREGDGGKTTKGGESRVNRKGWECGQSTWAGWDDLWLCVAR